GGGVLIPFVFERQPHRQRNFEAAKTALFGGEKVFVSNLSRHCLYFYIKMQLSQRVHLVGSGAMGLRLTHDLDCNIYLLDGGSELALIDAGGGVQPERIVAQIHSSGLEIARLSTLLLTHAHGD